MLQTRIFILLFSCLSFSLFGQESADIEYALEKKVYSKNPDVLVYLLDLETKVPGEWLSTINNSIKSGIKASNRFGEEFIHDPKLHNATQAYNTSVPYVAKLDVIDILVDGKNIGPTLPNKKTEYIISSNFILLDLVKGTRIASETIIFSSVSEKGSDEKFLEEMGEYIKQQILYSLGKTFPIILSPVKLGETNKEKAKTIMLQKYEYTIAGKPKYLGVYILDKTIEIEDEEPSYIFKRIGNLKDLKKVVAYNCEFEVTSGKSEIYEHFNNGTKLYITTLPLGK